MNRTAINIMSPKFWADCRLIYDGCIHRASFLCWATWKVVLARCAYTSYTQLHIEQFNSIRFFFWSFCFVGFFVCVSSIFWSSLAKHLLRRIMNVKESVFVAILCVHFGQWFAQRHQRPIVDQKEQRFVRSDLHAIANNRDELWHCELLRYEEFAFLQSRQVHFLSVTIDDNLRNDKNNGKRGVKRPRGNTNGLNIKLKGKKYDNRPYRRIHSKWKRCKSVYVRYRLNGFFCYWHFVVIAL